MRWRLSGEWKREETRRMTLLCRGGPDLKKAKEKTFIRFSLMAEDFDNL
jgi:hypothetical protein